MEGSISDEAQKYLQDEFAKENPGNTLKVEVQQWDGIVSKLQTSLASKNESPDLVEIGNTQTTTFAEVGAFADSTDLKGELGGDKLIPSFVEASTIDSKIYAYPLYAGARAVFYRKDLLEKAGLQVPSTIDELRDTVIKLQAANPEGKDGFAGMYLAAVDPHGVESYLFASGFDYAKLEGNKWVGKVNTPESLSALKSLQDIFKRGTTFGLDTKASQKSFERYFNDGTVGVMIATGNIGNKIDQGLWDAGKVGVMPLPSKTAGKVGATFAGGSNIAIAQNSANPELAKAAIKVIFSEGFQRLIAKDGWVPGNTTYGDDVTGPFSEIASDVVKNSKLTPNNAQWGVEFGDNRVNDFFTRLAKGEDVEKTAQQFNDDLDSIMNK
ncbi:extracellular solute-binding protein [Mobiluncus mulieris]|uniref:Extracellular solute-binding protein n=2 Tax=Mobiluncus mulieris TaxID=2052 RepID=A0A7Y0YIG9_9ACTO|nr:extracellular solute-binding protein [Mobiluncus mulieris]NMX12438.1 extracellular solute-binding protein [Mobiluncus mulieris]NMX20673.1 extracellular solute-binding protein [Mobiluncus mulieris]